MKYEYDNNYITLAASLIAILVLYTLSVIILGYTFVPVELDSVRNHATFVDYPSWYSKIKYYDNYRDADNYYYHVKMIADSINQNNIDPNYSTSILSGYPTYLGIENVKGVTFLSASFLYIFCNLLVNKQIS